MKGDHEYAKQLRAQRKRARRHRIMRDRVVTALYGDAGHRQCGKKARYITEYDAVRKAALYVAHGAPPLRAYECPLCGGWHLTSTPRTGG